MIIDLEEVLLQRQEEQMRDFKPARERRWVDSPLSRIGKKDGRSGARGPKQKQTDVICMGCRENPAKSKGYCGTCYDRIVNGSGL